MGRCLVATSVFLILCGCGGGESDGPSIAPAPREISKAYRGLTPLPATNAREAAVRLCQQEGLEDPEVVELENHPDDPHYFVAKVVVGRAGRREPATVWIHRFNLKGSRIVRSGDARAAPATASPAESAPSRAVRENASALVQ